MQDWARGLADLAATDTGRGSAALARAVPDDLGAAARLLAGALISAPDRVAVGIVTGFFIPRADPPAAETDGPLGAVLLALTVAALGGRAVVLTDERCAGVVEATLAEGLARATSMTGSRLPGSAATAVWPAPVSTASLTHLVSVERVGRSSDGTYRNMRGIDIGAVTEPLDELFLDTRLPRVAVGDGGNEVGMGRLPADLVADVVDAGATIRCVVDCDHLVVAGTSNWGAHALALAITYLAGPTEVTDQILGEDWSRAVLEAGVAAGAVDGVTATSTPSVDGLTWSDYWRVPAQMGAHLAAQPS